MQWWKKRNELAITEEVTRTLREQKRNWSDLIYRRNRENKVGEEYRAASLQRQEACEEMSRSRQNGAGHFPVSLRN
jgi:hypothetical protein